MPNGSSNTRRGKSVKAGTFKSKNYDGKTKRSTFSGNNKYGGGVKGSTFANSKPSSKMPKLTTNGGKNPTITAAKANPK